MILEDDRTFERPVRMSLFEILIYVAHSAIYVMAVHKQIKDLSEHFRTLRLQSLHEKVINNSSRIFYVEFFFYTKVLLAILFVDSRQKVTDFRILYDSR